MNIIIPFQKVLLGLSGVNMPFSFGERKQRPFRRLDEGFIKYSDHTLFTWRDIESSATGLLANSPDCFETTGEYTHDLDRPNIAPYQMTNKGISIDLYI